MLSIQVVDCCGFCFMVVSALASHFCTGNVIAYQLHFMRTLTVQWFLCCDIPEFLWSNRFTDCHNWVARTCWVTVKEYHPGRPVVKFLSRDRQFRNGHISTELTGISLNEYQNWVMSPPSLHLHRFVCPLPFPGTLVFDPPLFFFLFFFN